MTGQELYEVLRDQYALHLEIEIRDRFGDFYPLESSEYIVVDEGKVRLFS